MLSQGLLSWAKADGVFPLWAEKRTSRTERHRFCGLPTSTVNKQYCSVPESTDYSSSHEILTLAFDTWSAAASWHFPTSTFSTKPNKKRVLSVTPLGVEPCKHLNYPLAIPPVSTAACCRASLIRKNVNFTRPGVLNVLTPSFPTCQTWRTYRRQPQKHQQWHCRWSQG